MSVKDESLDTWDLCVFGRPRHPSFDNERVVQRLNCSYISLDFPTVAAREDFNQALSMAMALRDKANSNLRVL